MKYIIYWAIWKIVYRKFLLRYKRCNLRLNSTLGDWTIIRNSRKFAINKFAINVGKMYRLCTFLAGELEKLRNKRKFAISVFAISEFYCNYVHCELDLWPPKSLGFTLSPWFVTCLLILMKKHIAVESLSCSQAYFHIILYPLWPWPLTPGHLQNQESSSSHYG